MKKVHLGDEGFTFTMKGKTKKTSKEVELLGQIDELNSFVGLTISFSNDKKLNRVLIEVQKILFEIGAEIASNQKRITKNHVEFVEKKTEEFEKSLKPLNKFILPSGTKLASLLHVCRSIARRVERVAWKTKVSKEIKIFLNRLSDLFFVLARYANKNKKEIYWP